MLYILGNANYTDGKMWHDFSISSMIEVIKNYDEIKKIIIELEILSLIGYKTQTFLWFVPKEWSW